jgi:hypothetical protein
MVEPSRSAPVKRLLNCARTDLPCVSIGEQLAWLDNLLQDVLAGQPRAGLLPAEADIGETQCQELRSATLCRGSEVGYGHCPEVLALPNPSVVEILPAQLHQPSLTIKRTLSTDLLDRVELHSGAELAHRRDQEMESCRTHDQEGIKACGLAIGDNVKGQARSSAGAKRCVTAATASWHPWRNVWMRFQRRKPRLHRCHRPPGRDTGGTRLRRLLFPSRHLGNRQSRPCVGPSLHRR